MVIHKNNPQAIGKPIINKRFHWFAEGLCRGLFLNSVAKPLKFNRPCQVHTQKETRSFWLCHLFMLNVEHCL